MTASHPPYTPPQAQPQPQVAMTREYAAEYRALAAEAETKSTKLAAQHGANQQEIARLKGESEAITQLCTDLDAAAAHYRRRVREAGYPEEDPGALSDGPQTDRFQDPGLANDRDAALRPRPSQAREQMPAASTPRSEGR